MKPAEIFNSISPDKLKQNPFQLIGNDWFLITVGNREHYNTMTAGWGSFCVLWNKAALTTFIRPSRYTFEFAEVNLFFTLCFFGEEHRKTLSYCGTYSGRHVDKVTECNLSPVEIPDE
ncbi:MAG: hypothetical protein ISR55_08810 [Bacteroidetes bacterium]|nr:hypothetical protein [Bacteroidota bacterium]